MLSARWLLKLATPQDDLAVIATPLAAAREMVVHTASRMRLWWAGVTGWSGERQRALREFIQQGGYADDNVHKQPPDNDGVAYEG